MNNTPTVTKGGNRRSPVVFPLKRPPKRQVTFTRDGLNNSIAQVPLSDGSVALLDAFVFQKLISSGITDQWSISGDGDNRVYVRCRHKGRVITVSRLIMDAPALSFIRYKNGNRRDLRMNNLQAIQKKTPKHGQ